MLWKLNAFIVYSLSFNLADLDWPKEQSTSFRYLWFECCFVYFCFQTNFVYFEFGEGELDEERRPDLKNNDKQILFFTFQQKMAQGQFIATLLLTTKSSLIFRFSVIY